jgi:hypothetical protein
MEVQFHSFINLALDENGKESPALVDPIASLDILEQGKLEPEIVHPIA